MPYDEFRTGLSYGEVYHMMARSRWKRRHGVLGYWHQVKLGMYSEYLEMFEYFSTMKGS